MIILAPVRCSAIVPDRPVGPGAADPGPSVAAITFDLTALPAGSAVRYAGLELAGLSVEALADSGGWCLWLDGRPAERSVDGAVALGPALGWQLRRSAPSPGGRGTLELDVEARQELAARLGIGPVTFRLEGPVPSSDFWGWPLDAERAPRLRLAYETLSEQAPAERAPLVAWDEAPTP